MSQSIINSMLSNIDLIHKILDEHTEKYEEDIEMLIRRIEHLEEQKENLKWQMIITHKD